MSKTIDVFTKAKNKLIAEYHEAAVTVQELAAVLRNHGIKIPKKGTAVKPQTKKKGKKATGRKLGKTQQKIVDAVETGLMNHNEIQSAVKSKHPIYPALNTLVSKGVLKNPLTRNIPKRNQLPHVSAPWETKRLFVT